MDSLSTWSIEAGSLVHRILSLEEDADRMAVGARAKAALTLREALPEKKRRAASARLGAQHVNGTTRDRDEAARLTREVAFIEAAIAIIDAGGACTQEIEDDERHAALRRAMHEATSEDPKP